MSLVEIWYVLFVWCEMFRTTCNTNIFLLKNFNSNSSKPYDNLEYLPMKMGNLYKIYSSLSLEIWEQFLKYGFRSEVFDIVFCLTFSFYILWWLVIRMRPRNFNLYKICCVFFLENMQGKGYEHISKYFPSTVRLCLENISCWFTFKLFFKNVKPYEFKIICTLYATSFVC